MLFTLTPKQIAIGFLGTFALVLCIIQLAGVFSRYCQYEVRSHSFEESNGYLESPGVTVCADIVDLLPDEKLPEDLQPKIAEIKGKVWVDHGPLVTVIIL